MHEYIHAVDQCFERIGDGRLALKLECLSGLVTKHPQATIRYIEMNCQMAYSQSGLLKVPYVLALMYEKELGDDSLAKYVWKIAEEIGATDLLTQLPYAESLEAAKAEPPEAEAARRWWEETGVEVSACDRCDRGLRRGEGYLIQRGEKSVELLCRSCFDRLHTTANL